MCEYHLLIFIVCDFYTGIAYKAGGKIQYFLV